MRNCLDKLQQLADLFKIAGKRMYEETSLERQQLVKYTLTFSHILAEIKSLFPKDVYEGQNFRIAKKDAADFWRFNFGDRIIVSWKEFEVKLNRVHQITSQSESDSLRETIQLTKTKYVSIFEFDIFTRLFQPWNNLLNNWKYLVTEHPGYIAYSTYDEVHKRLQNVRFMNIFRTFRFYLLTEAKNCPKSKFFVPFKTFLTQEKYFFLYYINSFDMF
jgi:E3 ubiquitin-protein ligase CBL